MSGSYLIVLSPEVNLLGTGGCFYESVLREGGVMVLQFFKIKIKREKHLILL